MKIFLIVFLFIFSNPAHSQLYLYDNEYRGIKVGETSKYSVLSSHGKPKRKSKSSKYIKFHYDRFLITFHEKSGISNSIEVIDNNYLDANGIKIGFSKTVLEAVLKAKVENKYLIDPDKGIIYWFDHGKVSKIVLAHELVINN
jgi:hypothetical protein